MSILLFSVNSSAFDCPIPALMADYSALVTGIVQSAPTCQQSVSIAKACGYTGVRDSSFTFAAEQKCSADFMSQLSDIEIDRYKEMQSSCNHQFENADSPLGYSQIAFCRLSVTEMYSNLYRKAP